MSKFLGETSTPELIRLIKQDLSTKQDLIENPTQDNLAATDSSGQTIDSGISSDLIKNNLSDTDRYTDQCFLYRESLADNDGIAKIDKIKGNSLVFNQKVWSEGEAEINSIKGNTVSFNQIVSTKDYSNSQTDTREYFQFLVQRTSPSVVNIISERIENTGIYKRIVTPTVSTTYYFKHNGVTTDLNFFSLTLTADHKYFLSFDFTGVLPNVVNGLSYTNAMIMDLTLMGIDNLTTTEEVEAWLSTHIGNQPYYDYTPGTLVSFNGTGLKTTGKNLLDNDAQNKSTLGFTYTINEDGSVTVQGKRTSSGYAWLHYCSATLFSTLFRVGESYTLTGTTSNVFVYIENTDSIHVYEDLGSGVTFTYNGETNLRVAMYVTTSDDTQVNETIYPMIRLSSVSDATFEPYTSDVIILPNLTFNIWDEDWEVGSISGTTGLPLADDTYIRSKKLIKINPSSQYYVTGNSGKTFFFLYYDSSGNYIGTSAQAVLTNNRLFTPNVSNAFYCKFTTQTGGDYNNDICINISNPEFNGIYKPYNLPLFPDGMMEAGSAYDEMTNKRYTKPVGMIDMGVLDWNYSNNRFYTVLSLGLDVTVRTDCVKLAGYTFNANSSIELDKSYFFTTGKRLFIVDSSYTSAADFKAAMSGHYVMYQLTTPLVNYGVVDLGTLDWALEQTGRNVFLVSLSGAKNPINSDTIANILTPSYLTDTANNVYNGTVDKSIGLSSSGALRIRDTSYTDATAFKSAMSGVYLLYELTTLVAPSLDLSYPVYVNGTEQLIPQNGIVPVTSSLKANIDYPYGVQETEFIYRQTLRNIVLTNGHYYITKVNGTWSNVSGTGQTLTVGDDDMVIDLTQMANPYITNYSQFAALYPDHYDFEKGKLVSFIGSGLKTVGFNQWDEQWENGYLGNNGSFISDASSLCAKNYYKYLQGTTLYGKVPAGLSLRMCFYDANKTFISLASVANVTFTPPTETYYIRFSCYGYGATYNNDICVNISDDSRNGTYEPYQHSLLDLPTQTYFSTGMKSAGNAYDEISDKAYTKIGSVDLGTLNWNYNSDYQVFASSSLTDRKEYDGTSSTVPNFLCNIYKTGTNANSNAGTASKEDKTIFARNGDSQIIWVKDSSYTDATDFKQMLIDKGSKLYYELATPTETDVSLNLNYIAWKGGTEEILSDSEELPPTSPFVGDLSYLGTKDTILSYNDIILDLDNKVDSIQTIYYGDSTIID